MMGKISFYLKKPEPVGRKSLIFLQWKYRGQRLVFSTGETINPKTWNYKTQRIKGENEINSLLDSLKLQCKLNYDTEIKNGIPTPEMLRTNLDLFMNKNIKVKEVVIKPKRVKSTLTKQEYYKLYYQNNKERHHQWVKDYRAKQKR